MGSKIHKRCISTVLGLAMLLVATGVFAANSAVRFNEIMAGLNGDSSIQFIELAAQSNDQKGWGPAAGDPVGRTMLVFYNQNGEETGRYVLPHNPLGSVDNNASTGTESNTVLFATQAFAALSNTQPDYIIPALISANAGKLCFQHNPDNIQDTINLCIVYGGTDYTGVTSPTDPPNPAQLSILDSASLSRNVFAGGLFGDSAHLNSQFSLATPTPASTQANPLAMDNSQGEVVLPIAQSMIAQGRNLFFKETFNGNGRTCDTCHREQEKFGITPAMIAQLPADDPLFRNEQNINVLVVNAMGSVLPSDTAMSKPSDFFINDMLTGSLGGGAKVLATQLLPAPVNQKRYLVVGGEGLDIPGNVIADAHGNTGTLVSFSFGNLSGPNPVNGSPSRLENSTFLRGGRALVLENINGFPEPEVQRASPSLMNLKFTAPYGLSAEFPDLQSFTAGAIRQHFPRRLDRVVGTDFREATTKELDALSAFQNSIVTVADPSFGQVQDFLFSDFVTTAQQKRGRDVFFSACSFCHSNGVLADEFRPLNTGVANLPINVADGLPTEQNIGAEPNSREFSVPTLFDLRFTAPFFHDNSVATLRDAILFYTTPTFANSPEGFFQPFIADVLSNPTNVDDLESFLRALSARPFNLDRQVSFLNTPVGASQTKVIVLANTGTESMEITAHTISGLDAGEFAVLMPATLSGPLLPGENREISIVYTPGSIGDKTAILEMDIQAGQETYSVGVDLTGSQGSPVLQFAPPQVDFGDQGLDPVLFGPTSQSVLINNSVDAGATLHIQSVTIAGDNSGEFTSVVFGFNDVPPGGQFPVQVTFNPTTLGEKTATLVIASNDPQQPIVEIPLRGNAIDISLVSIDITAPSLTMNVNDFLPITSTGLLSNGTTRDISFSVALSSSNPQVADALFGSAVVGIAPGTATINASFNGVVSNNLDITVTPPPAIVSIEIFPPFSNLSVGEAGFFFAIGNLEDGTQRDVTFEVEWVTSDPTILDVQFGGFALALAEGTATVTARSIGTNPILISNTASVTVVPFAAPPPPPPPPPVVTLEIVPATATVELGTSLFLSALGTLNDGSQLDMTFDVVWSSSDTNVLFVDFDGFVATFAEGTAVVTATTPDGISASSTITVTAPVLPPPPVGVPLL